MEGINQRIIGYEGFEAITLLDSILFCSIETRSENDTCYVIRGVVSKDTIEFDLKSLFPLLKRKRKKAGYNIAIENAGFECLTYVKNLDKLLLLFEYNNYPLTSSAFLLNTELTKIDTVDLQSIDFRLTDICEGNDRMVYAINHHYNGDYLAYEPDTVILKNNKKRYNWVNDSYSSIVKIDISKNKYTIKPVGTISPAVNNWEGIVPFYKGFLLVTDYYPGSKLVYFEF